MAAPIALFVYNRLWHTQQTVAALQQNHLATESDLFIFSDAPKDKESFESVQLVRDFIRNITDFKSVTIIEREKNFGLAGSIIDGVSLLCNQFGRVIVLEDDLVTSPFFLKFMNDALDLYANSSKVMHVSGYVYPIGSIPGDTFFFRVPMCWGWATWERSWQYFWKSDEIMTRFTQPMRNAFSFDETYHFWRQLENNKNGLINTWFVYWYASIFLQNGMALFPSRSLVNNIGHDGSGVHCKKSDYFHTTLSERPIPVIKKDVYETEEIVLKHYQYFKKTGSASQSIFRVTKKICISLKCKVHDFL